MKKVVMILCLAAGVYFLFQGIDVLMTTARGESIYRAGLLIPAQDTSLLIYGSGFLLTGALFMTGPFAWKLISKSTVKG
ncbi:hypothetical protein [Paenibacillus shenyangensis]|uniref:hypothetical protein n=1 Tax=Paenibacillus sp. A9 TaxID=1284352 RepID=UPI0003636406|nr:hypothetical protein [Paenibacillus sp. A9]